MLKTKRKLNNKSFIKENSSDVDSEVDFEVNQFHFLRRRCVFHT